MQINILVYFASMKYYSFLFLYIHSIISNTKTILMPASTDHRSAGIDLDFYPTVEGQPTPPAIQLETTDYSELLRKVAGINTLSLTCSIVCIAFDLIFTLIILGMGGSNRSSCPMEPRLPIYLIVYGSINLVSLCFSISACIIYNRRKDDNMYGFYYVHCAAIMIIIFQLFNFIWLIMGSIWVFRIFNDVQYTQINQSTYCQGNIYQFTIVTIILQYVLPFIFCCCKNIPFDF
jgi:hypothetical protein